MWRPFTAPQPLKVALPPGNRRVLRSQEGGGRISKKEKDGKKRTRKNGQSLSTENLAGGNNVLVTGF